MDSLPFELAQIIVKKLPTESRLRLRLVSRWCNEQVVASFPDCCEIEELQLRRHGRDNLGGFSSPRPFITFHARLYDSLSSLHFVPLSKYFVSDGSNGDAPGRMGREPKLWMGPVNRAVNLEDGNLERREIHFTIKYPPTDTVADQYPLFEKAKIKHFYINSSLPLYLDHEGSLERLTKMFEGCQIEKVTFAFDKISLEKILKVPAFLKSVKCQIVKFYLAESNRYDMFKHFMTPKLPADLAAAGIQEVHFDHGSSAREQDEPKLRDRHPHHGQGKPSFNFVPLIQLISSGITRFLVPPDTLSNQSLDLCVPELDDFLDKVSDSEKPLNIRLFMRNRSELPAGRYMRGDDEKYGRVVDVVKRWGQNPVWTAHTQYLSYTHEIITITTRNGEN